MAMISMDMRFGRSDEQKRKLAAGLLQAVSDATGLPVESIFLVLREGQGINFVEHGQHLPDYGHPGVFGDDVMSRLG
jgi:trans-3-chloroacrylic acid dehalogenase alpha subunit